MGGPHNGSRHAEAQEGNDGYKAVMTERIATLKDKIVILKSCIACI
jgi:hypothetical protein